MVQPVLPPVKDAMLAPSDLFSVRGRTALVTGGATGLGRVCAEALLAAGARVLIASRKSEACEAAAAELSAIGPCEGFGGTVANEAGVAALAAEARKRADVLHILVNNAGLTWGEPFETYPWKAWERVMAVNVAGLFSLTRDLAPMLVASASADRPSTVVNLGSVMGHTTQSETAYAYSASKAARASPDPHSRRGIRRAAGDDQRHRAGAVSDQHDALRHRRRSGRGARREDRADGPARARRGHRGRAAVPDRAGRRLYDGRNSARRRRHLRRRFGLDVRRRDMSVWADAPKIPADELAQHVGQVFHSHWFVVDQGRIDAFAKVTEDEQFIHVDPVQAAATPFGGTVAHGFLTLSMLSPMAYSALPRIEGIAMGVNYGFDRVRFLHPVRSGSRVRARFTLMAVTQRSPREWQLTYDVSVEIEGQHKPALAATWLTMQVMGAA